MASPTTLIIRTAGTNCDRELAYAFQLAGATPQLVHLNQLVQTPELLDDAAILALPGGFSYGDDIAAGRILANRLRHRLLEPIQQAVARGVPVIGICNGFQVLVKIGLLPAVDGVDASDLRQTATLADNTNPRFLDRWVELETDPQSPCIWTRGIKSLQLPIAHGEGRFLPQTPAVRARIREQHQAAVRYAPHDNPNGSVDDVAGLCDPSGLVFGLMPHPERFIHPTQHPAWTRAARSSQPEGRAMENTEPAGLRIIRNAVAHVTSQVAAGHES